MSNTVSGCVNGTHEALRPAKATPRTWTFVNRYTGEQQAVKCMAGCIVDHSDDIDTPTFPEDVYCQSPSDDVTLPINTNGIPEEYRVLSSELRVMPFSSIIAERLPHAMIEMLDEHYIDCLDPDGLATVISTFRARLDRMDEQHARLVQVRASYMTARA